ncbi:MAG: NAD(+) synthase, partial [Desulfobacterales bacterium]|nr:NAD(+) synthase [Desulfobacterales bacterium]
MNTPKIIDHIVDWLTTYVEKAGMKGFVVGVSGGIDSAVTSALCARTGKPVLLVNMPIYQVPEQVQRATDHIAALEAAFDTVNGVDQDLTPAFSAIESTFPQGIQDDLTMANSRARLRMLTLYAFAGHHTMLVAGTGNKVEDFGVGFYTKYGDGGVDLSPIADLVKSQGYELGRELGVQDAILNAPPTAGLFGDDRTDEGQIGASYDELEAAMAHDALPPEAQAAAEAAFSPREKQVL